MVINTEAPSDVQSLDGSISSRFQGVRLDTILHEMFVEQATSDETRFDLFYKQCAPSICSYRIVRTRDIITALLLLITVCVGLYRCLRLVASSVGKLIFILIDKRSNPSPTRERMTIGAWLQNIHLQAVQNLFALNLFESNTTNPEKIRKERKMTRVYLTLLAITVAIVLFYSSIIDRIVVKTYLNPSIADYEQLIDLDLTTVDCPCARISIPYSTFVTQLEVESYHQICSYDIISNIFKDLYVVQGFQNTWDRSDYRSWNSSFVDGLSRLCRLANDSVQNDIDTFLASNMLVYQLIPRIRFEDEIDAALNRVKTATSVAFARTLDLLRTIFQANSLLDAYLSNWQFILVNNVISSNTTLLSVPRNQADGCSCMTTRACSTPAQVLLVENGTRNHTIEGLVLGCFVLETILRSSLSCFYSISCVQNFQRAIIFAFPNLVENWNLALNATQTRFSVNDTIETLAYDMFIESWAENVSYEMFFEACTAKECTYSYHVGFDILEIITTFLSVFSGLSLGLRLLVPCLISVVGRARQPFRVTPT